MTSSPAPERTGWPRYPDQVMHIDDAACCETCLMLDSENGAFEELDLGFTPSPSGCGMCLLQEEEVDDGFLLLVGYTPSLGAADRKEATALVTVVGLIQSVFGYPNEEAYWFDSRGDLGCGFYELTGSRWHSNVLAYNQRTYGSRYPSWQLAGKHESPRHFFIGSKDVSAQFLAQGVRVESFTGRPHRSVRDEALRRVDDWVRWSHIKGRPADRDAERVRSYPDNLR